MKSEAVGELAGEERLPDVVVDHVALVVPGVGRGGRGVCVMSSPVFEDGDGENARIACMCPRPT